MTARRAIVESPYAGDVERNVRYARRALADAIRQGYAPFASHLLYTQQGVLDDDLVAERELGIALGEAWRPVATITLFYVDLGWSSGMLRAKEHCESGGHDYRIRQIGVEP